MIPIISGCKHNFIVLPNDKITIDDITFQIPFFCNLSVAKNSDGYNIIISKLDRLENFQF